MSEPADIIANELGWFGMTRLGYSDQSVHELAQQIVDRLMGEGFKMTKPTGAMEIDPARLAAYLTAHDVVAEVTPRDDLILIDLGRNSILIRPINASPDIAMSGLISDAVSRMAMRMVLNYAAQLESAPLEPATNDDAQTDATEATVADENDLPH